MMSENKSPRSPSRSRASGLKPFLTAAVLAFAVAGPAYAIDRFPRPDFQDETYAVPITVQPPPRAGFMAYVDTAALAAALGLAAYLALVGRSRNGLLALAIASLIYFGFYRKGCICPIGSIQNLTLALADPGYTLPWVAALFFLLPLLAAGMFGRVFCAAVCPLGAIQDIFVVKPLSVPRPAQQALGMLPYAYLAVAVLLAAMAHRFTICEYDPFVGFFRMSASPTMLAVGAVLLLLGMVVARPYCRFLCPYGVLLRWLSRVSWWHAAITPTTCVDCRLCEEACPFGAILPSTTVEPPPEPRARAVRRMALILAVAPVAAAAAAWAGAEISEALSQTDYSVALADRIRREDAGEFTEPSLSSKAFRASGGRTEELFAKADASRARFRAAGWAPGAFLGLIFMSRIARLAVRRRRKDYEMDRAECLSCGRCFRYCPQDKRNKIEWPPPGKGVGV
jgi:NosR/NirI family transcriptional regulator, nitrous oxide reductase regulator